MKYVGEHGAKRKAAALRKPPNFCPESDENW